MKNIKNLFQNHPRGILRKSKPEHGKNSYKKIRVREKGTLLRTNLPVPNYT